MPSLRYEYAGKEKRKRPAGNIDINMPVLEKRKRGHGKRPEGNAGISISA